jgi:hypothetical protein
MPSGGSGKEICPRCEEGILVTIETPQDIRLEGSRIRIGKVQVDECRICGFRSLSGREVGLFEILFAPQYAHIADLVAALKTAGYYSAFLREDQSESALTFGSRAYVAGLAEDLRDLYLDNESGHILRGLNAVSSGTVPIELQGKHYQVKLPKIGEGENGIVYDYEEDVRHVLKFAKPRPYSREHLREEYEVTDFFLKHAIPVPKILESDPCGSYMIKEKLAGDSLAKIYDDLGPPGTPLHEQVKNEVARFVNRLIELFDRYPETKTSVSPNNIFVLMTGNDCRCLLVDTGPAPLHDYRDFIFNHYWEKVIPEKIKRYREVGYL